MDPSTGSAAADTFPFEPSEVEATRGAGKNADAREDLSAADDNADACTGSGGADSLVDEYEGSVRGQDLAEDAEWLVEAEWP
jgi:hypothetical protein